MEGKKGALKECVKHWADSVGEHKAVPILSEFTGLQRKTVRQWLQNDKPARGFVGIQLAAFADVVGYEITDDLAVDSDIATVGRLMGLGLIKLEYLTKVMQVSANSVCRIMRGGANTSEKRMNQLRRVVKDMKGKIEPEKMRWLEKIGAGIECSSQKSETAPAKEEKTDPQPSPAPLEINSSKIVDSLVSIFNSMGNIASVGIDPKTLSPDVKLHIAYTTAQLFKRLGIDAVMLEQLQRRQEQSTGNMSNLARIFRVLPGGK
jgi:hypothetical protein